MRVWLLIVSLLAAVAVGCEKKGGDDTLPPPVSTSSSTTSTTVSYAVPEVIDAAYVARVMQALDHVYGDAVRHLAQTRRVDEEFLKYLVAIYNPRIFKLTQDAWVKLQAQDFPGLLPAPGDPTLTLTSITRPTPECVVVDGDHSLSPLFDHDDPTNHHRFIALVRLDPHRNPSALNPTPWAINFDGQGSGGTRPEDICVPQ